MGQVTEIAAAIKIRVRNNTKLAITIGGGTTKTVAKIASQLAKPDGLMVIAPGEESAFLEPLNVEMISGIGPVTGKLLKGHGIAKLGDLAAVDEHWLTQTLGRKGPDLKGRAMGIDTSAVEPHRETKSVSAETTMAIDVDDEWVLGISKMSIRRRLRKAQAVSANW